MILGSGRRQPAAARCSNTEASGSGVRRQPGFHWGLDSNGSVMSARVTVTAVVEGMEMQSDELHCYLHRLTGGVVTVSDEALTAAENDDEEWIGLEELAEARRILVAADDYLALPDRFEIDEYRMMQRFARGLPDDPARDAALASLGGRGAFRYFKDTVHRLGLATLWYAYRDECYREVARAWCETHGIEHDDSVHPDA